MRQFVVARVKFLKKEAYDRRTKFNTDMKDVMNGLIKAKTEKNSELEFEKLANVTESKLLKFTNNLLLYLCNEEEIVMNATFAYRKKGREIQQTYNESHSKAIAFTQHLQNYQRNKLDKFTYYDRKISSVLWVYIFPK